MRDMAMKRAPLRKREPSRVVACAKALTIAATSRTGTSLGSISRAICARRAKSFSSHTEDLHAPGAS